MLARALVVEHLAWMSNFNAEGIDVCSVGGVDVVDMTMLRAPRKAAENALLYLKDPVIMVYLNGVRICQAEEIFINNQ